MNKSELKQLIKEEISNMVNEDGNISKKHITKIQNIIDTLSLMQGEIDDDSYVGWGTEDIKRLIDESIKALSKLPRLITKNSK